MGPLHMFQQAVDHGIDGDAVSLRPVTKQDPMPERRVRERRMSSGST